MIDEETTIKLSTRRSRLDKKALEERSDEAKILSKTLPNELSKSSLFERISIKELVKNFSVSNPPNPDLKKTISKKSKSSNNKGLGRRLPQSEEDKIATFIHTETMEHVDFGDGNLSKKLAQEENKISFLEAELKHDIENFLSDMLDEERVEFENFISQSGMVREHAIIGAMFAKVNGITMIFRPINPSAAQKLELFYYLGKTLGTKGKSSYFPPINGEIPFIAALSFLGERPQNESEIDKGKRRERIKEFQKKNENAIANPQERYDQEIQELKAKGISNLFDQVKELNKSSLETKINKEIEYGSSNKKYQLFYLTDKDGEVVWDEEKNGPLFVIDLGKDGGLLKLNSSGKPSQLYEMPKEYSKQKVEILAYRQFAVKNGKIEEVAPRGIAPDYDLLTVGARRVFPFENNNEIGSIKIVVEDENKKVLDNREIYGIVTKEQMFEILKNGTTQQKSMLKEQLLQHVLEEEKERFSYGAYDKKLGIVTQLQKVITTVHYIDFLGASSHGPDAGNPFPEEFTQANYPVFLPNGKGIILKNEKEICNFINEQINLGYPMDINPKWGWKRDESTGNFYIPDQKDKFDWKGIESQLKGLEEIAKQAETTGNRSSGLSISSAKTNYEMEMEIYKAYVEFLRLDQKPKLVFNEEQSFALETEFEMNNLSVEDYKKLKDDVCEMHRLDRIQKSIEAFNKILKLENEFSQKYEKSSISGRLCDIQESRIEELQKMLEEAKLKEQPKPDFHATKVLQQINHSQLSGNQLSN